MYSFFAGLLQRVESVAAGMLVKISHLPDCLVHPQLHDLLQQSGHLPSAQPAGFPGDVINRVASGQADVGIVGRDALQHNPNRLRVLDIVNEMAIYAVSRDGVQISDINQPRPDRTNGKWIVRSFGPDALPFITSLAEACETVAADHFPDSLFRSAMRDVAEDIVDVLIWVDRPSHFADSIQMMAEYRDLNVLDTAGFLETIGHADIYKPVNLPIYSCLPAGLDIYLDGGDYRNVIQVETVCVGRQGDTSFRINAVAECTAKVSCKNFCTWRDHLYKFSQFVLG